MAVVGQYSINKHSYCYLQLMRCKQEKLGLTVTFFTFKTRFQKLYYFDENSLYSLLHTQNCHNLILLNNKLINMELIHKNSRENLNFHA